MNKYKKSLTMENQPAPAIRTIEGPRMPCAACIEGQDRDCKWFKHEDELRMVGEEMQNGNYTPREIRHSLYKLYIRLEFGPLTLGDRRELPACVEDTIKETWPNQATGGNYVGFRA
jgi:hypothetical protein